MHCNTIDSARGGFTESSDTKANMPLISSLSKQTSMKHSLILSVTPVSSLP